MASISRERQRLHRAACQLVEEERALSEREREFVLEHWHEVGLPTGGLAGAFFTPMGLARDASLEVCGDRVIDLCAGTGRLAWACRDLGGRWGQRPRELVCVERDPELTRVGRRVLPEASWICGDVLDVPGMGLGRFDCAVGNPPFGRHGRGLSTAGYRGPRFEYHVIAVAAQIAHRGVFVVPQTSAPFHYSGKPFFTPGQGDAEHDRFVRATGIHLEPNCGIDTSYFDDQWHGAAPRVEIVVCDFETSATTAASTTPAMPGARGLRATQPRPATRGGEQSPLWAS